MASFVARAAEKLRRQGELAHVLTVFISQNRFGPEAEGGHSRSAVLTLPVPRSDMWELTARAGQLLVRLWELGATYVKAGVVLAGLEPPGGQQLGLFEAALTAQATIKESRVAQLMAAWRTPAYTTRLEDLLTVS